MKDGDPHLQIVEYDKEYPEIYRSISKHLKKLIPHNFDIDHVGSTAIPGCGGRRIIDILIQTEKEYMHRFVDILVSKEYKYNPEGNLVDKLFVSGYYKYKDEDIHVHIHITYYGSREAYTKILFRDYLRKHPDEARNYHRTKLELMEKSFPDRNRYIDLKSTYIEDILKKAEKDNLGS
jgi:GrpB-like predicted nucleotidyltransferase (UPF0157 family)